MTLTRRYSSGFTLVEVMITVLVIGIIVAIGVPNYKGIKEKALDREAVNIINLLSNAEKQYGSKNAAFWPPVPGACGPGAIQYSSNLTAINGNFSMILTPDPAWSYRVDHVKDCDTDGVTPKPRYVLWAFRGTNASHTRMWVYNSGDPQPTCTG